MAKGSTQSALGQLESVLDEYLVKKAPALPANIKELIVKFAPWATVIMMLLLLPALLALFGISLIALPVSFFGGVGAGLGFIIALIGLGGSLVLEAIAIPGLFNRTRQGWNYAFYASLFNFATSILRGDLAGAIIGTVIGLYFLFQVKSYYK